jgi:ureidoglycolate lyase
MPGPERRGNWSHPMDRAPTYVFEASDKPSLPLHSVPLIEAADESVKGYGCLVDEAEGFAIEIVRWPAQGWRQVDEGTGDEGGFVEGIFHGEWNGDVLMGRNAAVGGEYVLGWSRDPQQASVEQATVPRD